MNSKDKVGGAITLEDQELEKSRAAKLLDRVKSNRIEQRKIPYRVDARTIIMVSPRKFKTLNK